MKMMLDVDQFVADCVAAGSMLEVKEVLDRALSAMRRQHSRRSGWPDTGTAVSYRVETASDIAACALTVPIQTEVWSGQKVREHAWLAWHRETRPERAVEDRDPGSQAPRQRSDHEAKATSTDARQQRRDEQVDGRRDCHAHPQLHGTIHVEDIAPGRITSR